MTLTRDSRGRFVIKQETREQLENDYIFSVIFRLADQFRISGKGREAVKGYVIGKLDGLKKRLIKYYGLKWYDFVYERTQIAVAIQDFVRNALFDGISQIAAEYAEIPENMEAPTPEEVEQQQESREEVPAPVEQAIRAKPTEKANYIHEKKEKVKVKHPDFEAVPQ